MVKKLVRDVEGILSYIGKTTEKTFEIKKGPRMGEKFKVFSIGFKLDGIDEWLNAKANTEAKVKEYLIDSATKRHIAVGDKTKFYLESEDEEGKYWRVVSICRTDAVREEEIIDGEEVKEVIVDIEKKPIVETKVDTIEIEKKADEISKTVTDYKIKEANKFELGMSKNCAIAILARLIEATEDESSHKIKTNWQKDLKPRYKPLVRELYKMNKELREELLGY